MCEVGKIFRGRRYRAETVQVLDECAAHALEASLVVTTNDKQSLAGMTIAVDAVGEFSLSRVERLQDDVSVRATHSKTTHAHAPPSLGDRPGRQFRRHRHVPFIQRNSRIWL